MKKKTYFLFFMLILCLSAYPQERIVTGIVTDASDGSTIPGVNVIVKGTLTGTVTDVGGSYRIAVSSNEDILVFSYIGYEKQEIVVGISDVINVSLSSKVTSLEELVVIGYGVQKRDDLTGSISSVSSEDIRRVPVPRLEQALQGKAAGVVVTQTSGQPGAKLRVNIRGITTINNSDPLFVVDGIPVSSIDYLNPGDVESVDILKDASASAIYGARGANGVILITTRKGKPGKATVNFDMYYGWQELYNPIEMCNASEFAMLYNEARVNANKPPIPEFEDFQSLGEGTNWLDQIKTIAPMANYQLTFTGGDDFTTYNISGNIYQQDGIIKNSYYDRYTIRINTEHKIGKRFILGENVAITRSVARHVPFGNIYGGITLNALLMDPTVPPRTEDGNYGVSDVLQQENPLIWLDHRTENKNVTTRIVGNCFGEYQIFEDLKFRSSAGIDLANNQNKGFYPIYFVTPTFKNDINSVYRDWAYYNTWTWENYATYSHVFAGKHDLSVMAGMSAQEQKYETLYGARKNIPSNDPFMQYVSAGTTDQESSNIGDGWSLLSYYGRVIYSFNNRYFVTSSFRRDGSSRFGAENKWGNFPSFSLAWKLSNEKFWPENKIVTRLKLRGGWGMLGNDHVLRLHDYASLVIPGFNYAFGQYPNEAVGFGSYPIRVPNPYIKWESVKSTNLGVDIGLFNDRWNMTADYFIKNTDDMLLEVPIPLYIGAQPSVSNAGSVKNQGFEFWTEYRRYEGIFQYNIALNFTIINNEVTDLGKGGESIAAGDVKGRFTTLTEVGQPVSQFYGWIMEGIFQDEEEIANHALQSSKTAPGDIKFKDIDGNDTINDKDKVFIGSPIPKFTYGFNATFFYKGIDLNIFLYGVSGNKVYNGYRFWTEGWGETNWEKSMLDRWTPENPCNEKPRVLIGDPNDNLRVSTRFVENGSYMRIRTLTLGYTLPEGLSKKILLKRLRIYFTAQNLLTLTEYSGFDPEIPGSGNLELGIDRGEYPQPRTYLLGLNITF
jgi:TonB-linked SusC/RagA family outer membrane protein